VGKQFTGIDIGSRTIKLVVVDEKGEIVLSLQTDTSFDPIFEAKKLLNGVHWDGIIACGLMGEPVVSLEDLLTPVPTMERVKGEVVRAFGEVFGYEMKQATLRR